MAPVEYLRSPWAPAHPPLFQRAVICHCAGSCTVSRGSCARQCRADLCARCVCVQAAIVKSECVEEDLRFLQSLLNIAANPPQATQRISARQTLKPAFGPQGAPQSISPPDLAPRTSGRMRIKCDSAPPCLCTVWCRCASLPSRRRTAAAQRRCLGGSSTSSMRRASCC